MLAEGAQTDAYEGHSEIGTFYETPSSFRRKEEFHFNDALIETDIVRIVEREGPIHEALLVRRVARMFQVMRSGHIVESRINSQIDTACKKRKVRRSGRFVWLEGISSVAPRRPAPGLKLRDIDHVPPEELEAAVLLVVRLTRGITDTELAREAARVLGYVRISDHVREIALEIVKKLLYAGALVVRGDQLFIPEVG